MNWLELVVVALAASRLTRLVVHDSITDPVRRFIWRRWPGALTSFGASDVKTNGKDALGREVGYINGSLDAFKADDGYWYAQRPRFIGSLIECHWCTGIWVGVGVFAVWWFYPVVVPYLAALAVAEVVGKLND